jgi:hypothetical protein
LAAGLKRPACEPLLGSPALLGQLGLAQPRLDRFQVSGQLRRQPPGVLRPILRPRGQAAPGQADEVGVGAAAVEAGEGVGQVGAARAADGLRDARVGVGRQAGQDLAQHRAQAEHATPMGETETVWLSSTEKGPEPDQGMESGSAPQKNGKKTRPRCEVLSARPV